MPQAGRRKGGKERKSWLGEDSKGRMVEEESQECNGKRNEKRERKIITRDRVRNGGDERKEI